MQSTSLAAALEQGLLELGVHTAPDQRQALLCYLELLVRWNSSYNLTAVRDPEQMVYRHLLDSLAVAPLLPLHARRIIDVGTGAGLPGVPLAILFPERQFDLLDSNGKKTRFLFQVKTALGLANMTVLHTRVESWLPQSPYDAVLSRAFASLLDMVECCSHLIDERGCYLAMKGIRPEAELEAVSACCDIRRVHELRVPGLEEQRHLIELGSRTGHPVGTVRD
jgi:16S rRNA (guanine527-N7)-methyltransferase